MGKRSYPPLTPRDVPAALEQSRITPARKPLTFRCFVYPKHGLYVAECIDLDLMAKAGEPEVAMRGLHDAVLGHVEVALETGEKPLLYRPAPLPHILHYYWVAILAKILKQWNSRVFLYSPDTPA
jgi:hypothetical protein